jgi:hypothetical protein
MTDPLDNLSQEQMQYFTALGMFTVSWAIVERCLDQAITIIYQMYGGSLLIRKLPKTLEQKISHLSDCHFELKTLGTFAAHGIGLCQRMERMREARHYLIHGVPYDLNDPKAISIGRARIERHRHTIVFADTGLDELIRLMQLATRLATDMNTYTERLLLPFPMLDSID